MTDDEAQARALLVLEHFIAAGYGADTDEARQRVYLNDTANIPIEIFGQALRVSRQTAEKDGMVPCGEVIRRAVKLHKLRLIQIRDPERYRRLQGGMSGPEWYNRMIKGQRAQSTNLIAPSRAVKEIAEL